MNTYNLYTYLLQILKILMQNDFSIFVKKYDFK